MSNSRLKCTDLPFLFYLSCSTCTSLPVPYWLACSGCQIRTVLSWLSYPVCPILDVLFLAILFWQSCFVILWQRLFFIFSVPCIHLLHLENLANIQKSNKKLLFLIITLFFSNSSRDIPTLVFSSNFTLGHWFKPFNIFKRAANSLKYWIIF
jgi:hypothetical protein